MIDTVTRSSDKSLPGLTAALQQAPVFAALSPQVEQAVSSAGTAVSDTARQLKLPENQVRIVSDAVRTALSSEPRVTPARLSQVLVDAGISPTQASSLAKSSLDSFSAALLRMPEISVSAPLISSRQEAGEIARDILKSPTPQKALDTLTERIVSAKNLPREEAARAAGILIKTATDTPDKSFTALTEALSRTPLFIPNVPAVVPAAAVGPLIFPLISSTGMAENVARLITQAPDHSQALTHVARFLADTGLSETNAQSAAKIMVGTAAVASKSPGANLQTIAQAIYQNPVFVTASPSSVSALASTQDAVVAAAQRLRFSQKQLSQVRQVLQDSFLYRPQIEMSGLHQRLIESGISSKEAGSLAKTAHTSFHKFLGSSSGLTPPPPVYDQFAQIVSAMLSTAEVGTDRRTVVVNRLIPALSRSPEYVRTVIASSLNASSPGRDLSHIEGSLQTLFQIYDPAAPPQNQSLRVILDNFFRSVSPAVSPSTAPDYQEAFLQYHLDLNSLINRFPAKSPPTLLLKSVQPFLGHMFVADPSWAVRQTVGLIQQVSPNITLTQALDYLAPLSSSLVSLHPVASNLSGLISSQMRFHLGQTHPDMVNHLLLYKMFLPDASADQIKSHVNTLLPHFESVFGKSINPEAFAAFAAGVAPLSAGFKLYPRKEDLLVQSFFVSFLQKGVVQDKAANLALRARKELLPAYYLSGLIEIPSGLNPDQIKHLRLQAFRDLLPPAWDLFLLRHARDIPPSGQQLDHTGAVYAYFNRFIGSPDRVNINKEGPAIFTQHLNAYITHLSTYPQRYVKGRVAEVLIRFFDTEQGKKLLATKAGKAIHSRLESHITAGRISLAPPSLSDLSFHPTTLRGYRIIRPVTRLASSAYQKISSSFVGKAVSSAAAKVAASAIGKAVANLLVKTGVKAAVQAALQALGSTVPVIGNIIAFVVGWVAGEILGKVVNLAIRAAKWVKENFVPVIGASVGLAVGAVIAPTIPVVILFGAVGLGASIVGGAVATYGLAVLVNPFVTAASIVLTPVAVVILILPIVVAFFLHIITSSAYVVPRSSLIMVGGPGSPGGGAGGGGGTLVCSSPTTGQCAISVMTPVFGSEAENASAVCNAESGGDPAAINPNCPDYSVGLFQINLYCHPNTGFFSTSAGQSLASIVASHGASSCYDAFSSPLDEPGGPKAVCRYGTSACSTVTVTNPGLLQDCVGWFSNAQNNIAYASWKFQQDGDWSAWTTAVACGIAP